MRINKQQRRQYRKSAKKWAELAGKLEAKQQLGLAAIARKVASHDAKLGAPSKERNETNKHN
jgi:hypothetical protein